MGNGEARRAINGIIDAEGRISISDLKEIMLPHVNTDIGYLTQQEALRLGRAVVARRKDANGYRTTFALDSFYIDIDLCKDAGKVDRIRERLVKNIEGIEKSRDKTDDRLRQIRGQLEVSLNPSSFGEIREYGIEERI